MVLLSQLLPPPPRLCTPSLVIVRLKVVVVAGLVLLILVLLVAGLVLLILVLLILRLAGRQRQRGLVEKRQPLGARVGRDLLVVHEREL